MFLLITGNKTDSVSFLRLSTKSFSDITESYFYSEDTSELVPAIFSTALLKVSRDPQDELSIDCEEVPE